MGDTLVAEVGQERTQEVIALIVASVTIPAGLAQSGVCHGSFENDLRET